MKDITLCHPRLQAMTRRLIEECGRQGLQIRIGETLRTVEEQDALYVQGRTRLGGIVTNALGNSYSSYHQWGTTFGIYRNDGTGVRSDTDSFFSKVGVIGVSLGLEWGGNRESITDKPRSQLPDQDSSTVRIKRLYRNPGALMKTRTDKERYRWVKDSDGWWCHRTDGAYPASKWYVTNHHWYLFNKNGYMCTSWYHRNDRVHNLEDGSRNWYYLGPIQDSTQKGTCWHSREDGAQEIQCMDKTDNIQQEHGPDSIRSMVLRLPSCFDWRILGLATLLLCTSIPRPGPYT